MPPSSKCTVAKRKKKIIDPYKQFIICANALSRALRLATLSRAIDPYRLALGAPSILHLLFTNDYLLTSWVSVQNVLAFRWILELYCVASS